LTSNILIDEISTKMDVATSGGSVEWRPQLTVASVDVGAVFDEQSDHLLGVVDTALTKRNFTNINANVQTLDHKRIF
jgi:hypothetical protein